MKLPTWRRRRREEELEEEIQSHLRMAIRDRMARGESAEEAESAAWSPESGKLSAGLIPNSRFTTSG